VMKRGMVGFGSAPRTRIRVVVPLLVAVLAPLGALGVIATPAGAAGNTWYVSASGSGSACTMVAPCATVTQALSLAGSGDTIEVAGTIADNVNVTSSVTITQWPGQAAAVLNGGGALGSLITVNSGLNVTLSGLTIENGSANGLGGGGVFDQSGTVTITHSVVENNTALTTAIFGGGGILVAGGSLTLDDSSVEGNTASFEGGGLFNTGGTVIVNDSTISDNSATGYGGGISNGFGQIGSLTMNDSTVAGNSAGAQGGGIFNIRALTVTDSTFSANSAPAGQGAGILDIAGGATTLAGTILATPSGPPAGAECAGGSFTDGGYNVDDDGTCGLSATNHSVSDSATIGSFLGPLADNGGPTQTIALSSGTTNPAEAAIPATFTAPGQTTPACSQADQRGVARGVPCDMGSFALTVPVAPAITSASATTFTAGTPGTFTVSTTGFPTPSLSETGSLPTGVTFVDNANGTATLSGTPGSGTGGTYPITITAHNGTSPDAVQDFTLTVAVPVPPAINSFVGGSHLAATPDGTGYWIAGPTGAVVAYGSAGNYGSMAGQPLNAPVVGITATPDGKGYWLVGADGGVFNFGDAGFYNSMGGLRLNKPVVGIAATPSGKGYWLVAADGGVFSFGDATFFGSMGGKPLNKPVVGIASHPNAQGYWLVASEGGVFNFGAAGFHGSAGSITLNQPVIGLTSTPDGAGYWLVAADGGVFAYSDATFHGSGVGSGKTPVGLIATSASPGYAIVDTDGTRSAFPS
jgi:hypothetical protein